MSKTPSDRLKEYLTIPQRPEAETLKEYFMGSSIPVKETIPEDMLSISATVGQKRVNLTDTNGNYITLSSDKQAVEVRDKFDTTKCVLPISQVQFSPIVTAAIDTVYARLHNLPMDVTNPLGFKEESTTSAILHNAGIALQLAITGIPIEASPDDMPSSYCRPSASERVR